MTSPEGKPLVRLHGLDTLRATAILLVMLYHLNIQELLPSVLAPIASVGWIGVDLFFVLSGFLIGSQLLKPYLAGQQPSLKDFYMRRAYRILPAFFVVLLLYVTVPAWREAPGPYAGWRTRPSHGTSCSGDTRKHARFLISGRSAWKSTSICFFH